MMEMKKYIVIFFLAVFPFTSFSLYGIDSIGAMGGVMFTGNSSDEGAPSPILPFIGAAASFAFRENSFIEPSIAMTANYYLWSAEESMALPAEIEYADSVLLLSIFLDSPYVMKYRLRENIDWGWLASPLLVLRVPMKTWGEGDTQKADILSYFYGGRFIFLEAGGLIEWNYSPLKSFKSRLDLLFPLYHLWDGGAITDQLSVRLCLIFSFKVQEKSPGN